MPAARLEVLVCLVRAAVLLFSAAALATADVADDRAQRAAVLFHLVLAVLSLAAVVPLAESRSEAAVRAFARLSTAADLVLYAGYCAVVTGRPGFGSLYGVLVLLVGPLRWGLPGMLATGLPVGLVAVLWPVPDTAGAAPGPPVVVALVLLLSLSAAGVRGFWRRSGARLRQAELMFQAAFEQASIGMALLDARLVVEQGNHALSGLLGVPVEELQGTDFRDWVSPQDRDKAAAALQGLPASPHAVRLEVLFTRPDGQLRWGLLAASWLEGAPGVAPRVVAQVENVTERKSAEQRLAHQALHDELTGLPNRSYLAARLQQAFAHGTLPCLVFLDLDRFKVVNDGMGHSAGDRLLVEVASRLQAAVRPGDLVARLGGDEFVVLAAHVEDEEQAVALGERVLAALRAPVRVDPVTEVAVAASAGVALADPWSTPDTLLRDADTAMYSAKGAGGGRLRVFTPELHHRAKRTQQLEVDLRRALAEEQLTLTYQPVVHLTTGRVVEAEALLRWSHPDRGPIAPSEFVTLAEQSGLIDDLGHWVLARAVREAATWPAGRGGSVPGLAVNVSLRQLLDRGFPAHVRELLRETGFPPGRLCLEVTETALAVDTAPVVPVLQELRELGLRLAIDDFGTGHASLTYLAEFPVDVVKVDGSFVEGVAADAGSAAIVGGVVAMAVAFGLSVVAEGVETPEQLQALRRLGVDRAQGFLLSRPLTSAGLRAVLAASPAPDAVPHPEVLRGAVAGLGEDVPARFRVLLDGARDVTACVDLDDVLDRSFSALRRIVDFSGGSIQLVDGDVVRLAATDPPAPPEALEVSIPLGTGVSGRIAATGEPRYLPDITIAPSVTASRRAASSEGVRSWYGVPLVAEGRTIGVLQVESTRVDAFSDADRLLVLSFASVVASAVQGTRVFARGLDALQHPDG